MTFFNNLDRISNPYKVNVKSYLNSILDNDKEYALIWYGRISNGSNRKNAIKMIDVVFLDLEDSSQRRVKVPLELTTRLTIGSIWKNGETDYKYVFDDATVSIEEKSSNLTYSNHLGINKKGLDYEFNLENYPVEKLETDTNTLLIVQQDNHKVIIHPLTFYMAHYGVSKEINRVLLTYMWPDIEDMLNLDYPAPETSDTILIPDNCVIGDSVFLHYLKYSEHTRRLVRALNSRTLKSIQEKRDRAAPLKAVPYHEQQIDIAFKGIQLEANVILCTEITGMSMPQGDDISYTFYEQENIYRSSDSQAARRTFKPLFHQVDLDKVVVEATKDAGNSTTAIIRQKISTIGEIRTLVRAENITIEQVIQRQRGEVMPLTSPIPSAYAVGARRGSNKDIGILKCLISSKVVKIENLSFKKLLKYAQLLRDDPEYPQYRNMRIDCYSDNRLHGEISNILNNTEINTVVLAIYILRLVVSGQAYYIFDCTIATGINTSGIAIKVSNDDEFRRCGVDAVLDQLSSNSGRLTDQVELSEQYGLIIKFKHTRSASSNWIRTALENLIQSSNEGVE